MATLLTSLAAIKLSAKGSDAIQAMSDSDPLVVQVLSDIALWVTQPKFGEMAEMAQRFAAAHFLSLAGQPEGVRGHVSSESVGGITQTFTLPWVTQKDMFGATQYGMVYNSIVARCIPAFSIGMPKETPFNADA